jgi:hypothetical protein
LPLLPKNLHQAINSTPFCYRWLQHHYPTFSDFATLLSITTAAQALAHDQNWLMADLGAIRGFLRAERDRGNFVPVFREGLD